MRQSEYGNVRPRRCSNDNRIARTFNVFVVSANSWLPIRRKGYKDSPKGCLSKAENDLWFDDSYKLFEKSAVMFCPFLLIIAAGSVGSVAQNKVGEKKSSQGMVMSFPSALENNLIRFWSV